VAEAKPRLLEATGLVKVYDARGVTARALDGVDFRIDEGEFTALAGPSGSGKTTLLNMLGALDEPDEGTVRLDGQAYGALSGAELSELRLRKLGFVFQAYNLIPVFSARENVEFVMELQGVSQAERRQRAEEVLEQVGLGYSS
jgi:putative ABC transport system ATP-binding protein